MSPRCSDSKPMLFSLEHPASLTHTSTLQIKIPQAGMCTGHLQRQSYPRNKEKDYEVGGSLEIYPCIK